METIFYLYESLGWLRFFFALPFVVLGAHIAHTSWKSAHHEWGLEKVEKQRLDEILMKLMLHRQGGRMPAMASGTAGSGFFPSPNIDTSPLHLSMSNTGSESATNQERIVKGKSEEVLLPGVPANASNTSSSTEAQHSELALKDTEINHLKGSMASLTDANHELRKGNQRLELELEDAQTAIKYHEENIAELREEVSQLSTNDETQVAEIRSELDVATHGLNVRDDKLRKLTDRLNAVETQSSEKISILESELGDKNALLAQSDATIDEAVQSQLQSVTAANSEQAKLITRLKDDLEEANQNHQSALVRLDDVAKDIGKRDATIAELAGQADLAPEYELKVAEADHYKREALGLKEKFKNVGDQIKIFQEKNEQRITQFTQLLEAKQKHIEELESLPKDETPPIEEFDRISKGLSDANRERTELRDANERLRAELNDANQRIQEIQNKVTVQTQSRESADAEIQRLNEHFDSAQALLAKRDAALVEKEQRIKALEEEGKSQFKSHQEREHELTKHVAQREEEIQHFNDRLASLKSKDKEIINLNRSLSEAELAMAEHETLMERSREEVHQLNESIKARDTRLQALLADKTEADEQSTKLRDLVLSVQKQMALRDDKITNLQTHYVAASQKSQDEISNARLRIAHFEKVLSQREGELSSLNKVVEDKNAAIDAKGTEIIAQTQQMSAEHAVQMKSLESRIHAAQAEAEDAEALAEELRSRLSTSESELAKEMETLQRERFEVEQRLLGEKKELEGRLQKKAGELDETISTQNDRYFTLKEQREEEVDQLQGKIAKLEKAIGDRSEQVQLLNTRLSSVAARKDQLIAGLQVQLEEFQGNEDSSRVFTTQLAEKDRQIEALRDRSGELQDRWERRESDFAALQDRIAVLHSQLAESAKPAPDPFQAADQHVRTDSSYGIVFTHRPLLIDDLTRIKGIGEVFAKRLNELGIFRYKQIALWNEYTVNRIAECFHLKDQRITRDDWVGQARKCHKEEYGTDL